MIWQRVATIVICLSTLVLVAAFEADHDNEEWQASVFSHQDTVGAGNYSRFVLKHEGPLRIILHSIEGDADLYVSFRNETVSFELDKHDASSVTCGLDFVDIPSSPRPAYLGMSAGATAVLAGTMQLSQGFERGLRARSLGEQLATVGTASALMRDNPFPMFVNALVVRLADAFKEGSNELRACVARVLMSCEDHLSLVFSNKEVLKRIMTVSHSNDPEARALTLQMIASLAPVFPENNQVHHLIAESLSTTHELEFKSACHALHAFVKLSSDFSGAVMSRISSQILSTTTPLDRKTRLVKTFAGMRATVATTQEAFRLANVILITNQLSLNKVLLQSMTSLAEATRYAIPQQLDVILEVIGRADHVDGVVVAALQCLAQLAQHPHIWTDKHVMSLAQVRSTCEGSEVATLCFLKVLGYLAKQARPQHLTFFNEQLFLTAHLCCSASCALRASWLHVSCLVFCAQPSDSHAAKLATAFLCAIPLSMPVASAKKLYTSLGKFLLLSSTPQIHIAEILRALVDLPFLHGNQSQLLELFCLLADSNSQFVAPLRDWAQKKIQTGALRNVELPLVSFLLLSPECNLQTFPIRLENVADSYVVARTALRLGQWKNIALPILDKIDTRHMSFESAHWLLCLRELSASQPKTFTLKELEDQRRYLAQAQAKIDCLATGNAFNSSFIFPSQMIRCLVISSSAMQLSLTGLGPFVNMPAQFSLPNASVRVANMLRSLEGPLQHAVTAWNQLESTSFCADSVSFYNHAGKRVVFTIKWCRLDVVSSTFASRSGFCACISVISRPFTQATGLLANKKQSGCLCDTRVVAFRKQPVASHFKSNCFSRSLDFVRLQHDRMSVLLSAAQTLGGKQNISAISVNNLISKSTCLQNTRELVQWGSAQVSQLAATTTFTHQVVERLHQMFSQLWLHPLCLPRFFFQQFYSSTIKLSPSPSGDVQAVTSVPVPLQVDGVIEGNHPVPIKSVLVTAHVIYNTMHGNNFTQSQRVEPSDGVHFRAQFLMQFKSSCEVTFSVEFLAGESRRPWISTSTAAVSIRVNK